ncbi:hypothetical protein Mp_1g23390 [Marchantia polymorpha subsp. ruderalis]|uniref:Uncharacterized protein n=2 Tax=Marchantia polymorpha TaxID=3197 RepID=A0AAF6ATG0_MARPO|nr:hypothetical protein MARPO_0065s0039 [Marchantia polymorpha]BBM99730.1 hypothetical protein Mp_1g23390 [Marchantia polymorpha subsp. ruderalis]|eukprot:PTQ36226.1 hypothetical protein MARPO_0065s0039 [Marchantia polymorpha]
MPCTCRRRGQKQTSAHARAGRFSSGFWVVLAGGLVSSDSPAAAVRDFPESGTTWSRSRSSSPPCSLLSLTTVTGPYSLARSGGLGAAGWGLASINSTQQTTTNSV